MGQVQSQPQVQQPWSIWSLFGPPSYRAPTANPGSYAPMVYMSQATVPTQGVVAQKAPNVKVNAVTNKNKNKNKAVLEAPVVNTSATAVANVQPVVQNTSQSNPTSGGKRGKKKTRRIRR
jgi:hypothetical protein